MTVRGIDKRDTPFVAELHRDSIRTGFLSSLGERFLSHLYWAMSRSPHAKVLLAVDDLGTPVGFAACSLSTARMYRHVLLRHGLCLACLLGLSSFNLGQIRRVTETLRYGMGRGGEQAQRARGIGGVERPLQAPIRPELLAIAVTAGRRGERIGRALVNAVEEHFRRHRTYEYKVVSYSLDPQANTFYRSCGFRLRREFVHHGNVMYEYSKEVG